MQPTLIMFYGYTGAGKSTTIKILSNNLTKLNKKNIVLKTNIARMQGREKFNPNPSYFNDNIKKISRTVIKHTKLSLI